MPASEPQKIGGVHLRPRAILAIGLCALSIIRARADTSSQIALAHVAIVNVRDGSTKPDLTVLIAGQARIKPATAVCPIFRHRPREHPPYRAVKNATKSDSSCGVRTSPKRFSLNRT